IRTRALGEVVPDERRMQPSRPTGPPAPPYVPRPSATSEARDTRAVERSTALRAPSYPAIFGSSVAPRSSSPSSPDFRRRSLPFPGGGPGGWRPGSPPPPPSPAAETRPRTGPPPPLPAQSRITGPPPPRRNSVRSPMATFAGLGPIEDVLASERSTARLLE